MSLTSDLGNCFLGPLLPPMKFLLSLAAIVGISAAGRGAIAIEFDYSLDAISASPFLPVSSPARQTLEAARVAIGSHLSDSLASITPSGGKYMDGPIFQSNQRRFHFGGKPDYHWEHHSDLRVTTGPNRFNGHQSTSFNRGAIPLHADGGHWVNGIASTLPGMALFREAAMDPSIGNGVRKPLTVLDWAALDDVGWEVASSKLAKVPEPAEMAVAANFALMGFGLWG